MPPSLDELSRRLPLLVTPALARSAMSRLALPAARLSAGEIQTALRLFDLPRGGAPERRLLLLEILLHALARVTPQNSDAALTAALLRRDGALVAKASLQNPDAVLSLWTDLEHFLLAVRLETNAVDGLFAARWAAALAHSGDAETLAALNQHWLCRESFARSVALSLRGLRTAPSGNPAASPVFAGSARLAPETDLKLCSEAASAWLFLSSWGQAVARCFAASRPSPGRWRAALSAPPDGRFADFSLLGRTVRLPDVLTAPALRAFLEAFRRIDEAVRQNPALGRLYRVGEHGVFVPDAFVALPAVLWADLFSAAGVIAPIDSDHPASAKGAAPLAVQRLDEVEGRLVTGHLFCCSTGREAPARRLASRRALSSCFMTEETLRRTGFGPKVDLRRLPKTLEEPAVTDAAADVMAAAGFSPSEIQRLRRATRFEVNIAAMHHWRQEQRT